MKTAFNTNMFESIKTALEAAKSKSSGGNFKNILSIAAPQTYLVRLLPNVKNPSETFFHYYHHGWNSVSTGQYAGITSPSTFGERDIISELYFKILRNGSEDEQERAKANLRRKENWFVNVLVVNDPKNPDNNGTVKVLRYGKQINTVIEAAISGDDAQEFGAKIFDLSPAGCNLRIKAELVSDKPGAPKYPKYTASKFLAPSAIEGLTDDKIAEIYDSIFDLSQFVEHKTAVEIQEFINTHYYGQEAKSGDEAEVTETAAPAAAAAPIDDDVPYTTAAKETAAPASAGDEKVKAILDGLDSLS